MSLMDYLRLAVGEVGFACRIRLFGGMTWDTAYIDQTGLKLGWHTPEYCDLAKSKFGKSLDQFLEQV